ncbi:hypothetical protein GCM10009681_26450 [Luedemannella helvata]|uniref:MFS transporter n=2 Tax=Luedemannella helvata TaxID=349315 RepID=A0ABP4WK67_9ACTN
MYAWTRRHAARRDATAPATSKQRWFSFLLALGVIAMATVFFPFAPAAAGPAAPVAQAPGLCTVKEWQADIQGCVERLKDVTAQRVQCLKAPTPEAPDSGVAGWFATRPEAGKHDGQKGYYTSYGYAGYSYTTYDVGGCVPTLMHPDYKFENTVANGEFMLATGVIGASNALRERAWDPGLMWGWADPLVEKATKAVYEKVFTVFGAVTLAIVGLYLLWRSRQAEMSAAMTTAAWAVLVAVAVTAIASWPVLSAHLADQALVSSLSVVHDAVGPPSDAIPESECNRENKASCQDIRPPAVRASDLTVESMLYKNWLRGVLGSADSVTAQKYGQALYEARSFSWDEIENIRNDQSQREPIIQRKSTQWMKVAEQIRTEDPEAYEYLTGAKGMDRIGAGFIALLASVLFAMFDIVASLLVLLGFLIFRWAVIAAPILGTVALLRPASGGFRRLVNAVVAALFNIVIFGTGAAIYLFAVDLIMSTATLAGWLQVVLVWLCGVVGWLLLRPYRRITQLGGRDPAAAIASPGSWHRRFLRDARDVATLAVTLPAAEEAITRGKPGQPAPPTRTEQRPDDNQRPEFRPDGVPPTPDGAPAPAPASAPAPRRRMPPPDGGGWSEPGTIETAPSYSVYRPGRSNVTPERATPSRPAMRAEARQQD